MQILWTWATPSMPRNVFFMAPDRQSGSSSSKTQQPQRETPPPSRLIEGGLRAAETRLIERFAGSLGKISHSDGLFTPTANLLPRRILIISMATMVRGALLKFAWMRGPNAAFENGHVPDHSTLPSSRSYNGGIIPSTNLTRRPARRHLDTSSSLGSNFF